MCVHAHSPSQTIANMMASRIALRLIRLRLVSNSQVLLVMGWLS